MVRIKSPGRRRGEPRRRLLLGGERDHRDGHGRGRRQAVTPSTDSSAHPFRRRKLAALVTKRRPRPSLDLRRPDIAPAPSRVRCPSRTATTKVVPVDGPGNHDDGPRRRNKKHRDRPAITPSVAPGFVASPEETARRPLVEKNNSTKMIFRHAAVPQEMAVRRGRSTPHP